MIHMIRRLQQSGQLYHLSLPVDWVKKNSLDKGSEINLIEKGNELLLKTSGEESKKITINVKETEPEGIAHLILGLFESGAGEITINLSEKLSGSQIKYIKKRLYEDYAFNMIELSESRIKVSILLQSTILDDTVKTFFNTLINICRAVLNKEYDMIDVHLNQSQILRFSMKRLVNINAEDNSWILVSEFLGLLAKCLTLIDYKDKKYNSFVEKTKELLQKLYNNMDNLDELVRTYGLVRKLKDDTVINKTVDYQLDRAFRSILTINRELMKINTNKRF